MTYSHVQIIHEDRNLPHLPTINKVLVKYTRIWRVSHLLSETLVLSTHSQIDIVGYDWTKILD